MKQPSIKDDQDPMLENARLNLKLALVLRGADATNTSLKANLSKNALTTFLRGESKISYVNLLSVCKVLDIPIGILQQENGITIAKIRLHRILEALPDHHLEAALEAAKQVQD